MTNGPKGNRSTTPLSTLQFFLPECQPAKGEHAISSVIIDERKTYNAAYTKPDGENYGDSI
jgi:hypothetical protein